MSTILNHDLNKIARDRSRARAHKAKWAAGTRPAVGKTCWHYTEVNTLKDHDCGARPNPKSNSRNFTSLIRAHHQRESNRDNSVKKRIFHNSVVDAVDDVYDDLSDSSGDYERGGTTPELELNKVMYSFDAQSGPNEGGDVLSYALTQAVHRFENNETEKIVKNEYDVVLDGKDEPEAYVADADDDFELIDDSHLK